MPATPEQPDRPGSALPGGGSARGGVPPLDTRSVETGPVGASPLAAPPLDASRVDVLPCGVPLATLVDQVDDGRLEPADAHQAGCPHCRAALRAAATVDHALGLLRATTGPTPPGLVERVMSRVRQSRPEQAPIELIGSPNAQATGGSGGISLPGGRSQVAGGIRVGRQVVADLARQAAAGLRGVTVARAAAQPRTDSPGTVVVHLGLLVDGRTPLPELARQVREQVRAVLRRSLGTGQVEVELTALDLVDPD